MDEMHISVKDIPRIKKNTDGQTVITNKDVKKMKTLYHLAKSDGKYYIPTKEQFDLLLEYANDHNDRIKSPYCRFMLNYKSVGGLMNLLDRSKSMILHYLDSNRNYYLFQYDGDKIQLLEFIGGKVVSEF